MEIIDCNTLFGFWPKRNLDAAPEELIRRMNKAGVSRSLTCSLRGFLYDFKEGNDETIAVCRKYPDKFIPVATINPSKYVGIFDEVDRIQDLGFRIIRFFPLEQEWSISQRHFTKLMERIAQTDIIIMIPSYEGLTNLSNMIKGMNNHLIIESNRVYPHMAELIIVAQENPNIFIETHLLGCGIDSITLLVNEVGSDKLLYGSGAPTCSISASVLPILHADITDKVRERILSRNIMHLLGGNTYESN